MVSVCLKKPISALPHLSQGSPVLPLKWFQHLSDWQWPCLVLSRKIISSTSSFHAPLLQAVVMLNRSENGVKWWGHHLFACFLSAVMSYPAEGMESAIKNHIDDVRMFLETRHKNCYAVYNLSQRNYRVAKFENRVSASGWWMNDVCWMTSWLPLPPHTHAQPSWPHNTDTATDVEARKKRGEKRQYFDLKCLWGQFICNT